MFGELTFQAEGMTCHIHSDRGISWTCRVGLYDVEIEMDDDGDLTVKYNRRRYGSQDRSLEEAVSFESEIIEINVHKLLMHLLKALEPVEIAEHLWEDKKVRDRFLEKLADGWYDFSTDENWDVQRAALLRKMDQALTHHRVNRAADALRDAEYYEKKYWDLYHRNMANTVRPESLPPLKRQLIQRLFDEQGASVLVLDKFEDHAPEDPEYKIGSKNWVEARDWWRTRIIEAFDLTEHLEPGDG